MQMRSVLMFIVIALTAAFVALNWSVIVAPTMLSFGVRTVEAPLGLVMLCLMALLVLSFVVYALSIQGSSVLESRRQARELQAQRELADKAEASRFTELRSFMSAELLRVTQATDDMRRAMLARLDEIERQSHAPVPDTRLSPTVDVRRANGGV